MKARLDIHCAGPFSNPRQTCDARIAVPMPFDLESLHARIATVGWFVTVVSAAGENPPSVTVLCKKCGEALLPFIQIVRENAPS